VLISGLGELEFVDQLSDAAFDVVADGADGGGIEAGWVVEVVPGFVAFAGEDGTGVAALVAVAGRIARPTGGGIW
jgi:hypothetical protein